MRADALEKINAAALDVFAEYGFRGAAMRDIARAAGVSLGLAYHYYPSKEAAFRGLVDFALDASADALRAILAGPGRAWERIEAHAAMTLETMFAGRTSLYFLLVVQALTQGGAAPGLKEAVAAKLERYYGLLVPVIAQAQADGDVRPGDPQSLAAAYFAAIQGFAGLAFHGAGRERGLDAAMLTGILSRPGRPADAAGAAAQGGAE
jgi:AcrR family transcriptional regulator